MDRTLLANATSSEDTPTPGYMYNEIASKIFFEILSLRKTTIPSILTYLTIFYQRPPQQTIKLMSKFKNI